MIFKLEVETDGREVYCVEADSSEDARRRFTEGGAGDPVVSEVTGASVISAIACDSEQDCG